MNADSQRLEVGALSETGYTRGENQDRMSGSQVPLGNLYIVADGMGGHKGGAVAAGIAVQELQGYITQASPSESVDRVIEAAFKKANDVVYKEAHSGDPTTEGMGTTAVLLLVSGGVATLAHVGDSRAYLYRNSAVSQLTRDHTVVQRMIEAGMLKPEEASRHPDASVLERAIGSTPTVEVDIYNHQLQEGDAILLCSDGLCGYVADGEIEAALRHHGTVQETTARLVGLALEKGGHDNVTVQLIRYGAREAAPAARSTVPMAALPTPTATASGGPAQQEESSRRRLPALVIAALVIAGAAAAGVFALYHWNVLKMSDVRAPWERTGMLPTGPDGSDAAKAEMAKEVAALKRQLTDATQAATTTTGKLQKDLQDLATAKQKTDKGIADLTKEVAAAKGEEKRLLKELQTANAASEAAAKRVRDLERELKEKESALRQAEKQVQATTNRTPPGNQETTAAKDTTEASGVTDGTGVPKR